MYSMLCIILKQPWPWFLLKKTAKTHSKTENKNSNTNYLCVFGNDIELVSVKD